MPCTREAAEPHRGGDGATRRRSRARCARVDRLCVSRAADECHRMGRQARSDAHGPDRLPARQAHAACIASPIPGPASTSRSCRTPPSASRPTIRSRTCRSAKTKGIRPGGFGLLTVRASVDELLYNEKRNEVVFVKYPGQRPTSPGVQDAGDAAPVQAPTA